MVTLRLMVQMVTQQAAMMRATGGRSNEKSSFAGDFFFFSCTFDYFVVPLQQSTNNNLIQSIMNKFFDETGSLDTDGLIMERPSFQHLMADGVVTDEKIEEQGQRVKELVDQMEPQFTPEQMDQIHDLVAEVSVLLTLAAISDRQG